MLVAKAITCIYVQSFYMDDYISGGEIPHCLWIIEYNYHVLFMLRDDACLLEGKKLAEGLKKKHETSIKSAHFHNFGPLQRAACFNYAPPYVSIFKFLY